MKSYTYTYRANGVKVVEKVEQQKMLNTMLLQTERGSIIGVMQSEKRKANFVENRFDDSGFCAVRSNYLLHTTRQSIPFPCRRFNCPASRTRKR